ncbi:MAG TPA: CoA ester lyase [Rhodospirillales bacterium]|nr:CoA ester lyase [Rhodospirillales bacterium]
MTNDARPRRSMLYMPGSNTRALEKGKGLGADALILDLEDAVAPDAKEAARQQIGAAVKAGGYGHRELIVRVNGLATPWGRDDLTAACGFAVDAVLLPKVENADTVHQAEEVMDGAGAPPGMSIWCMMETPLAMLHAEDIAAAGGRLGGLVMGTSDLAADLHAAHTRDRLPMITGLGLCILAARAVELPILDGVYLDLKDDGGFEYACGQGAEFGFDGKTLIHPKQIEAANKAFAPSADEIEWSRRIIAAHAEAEKEGQGVLLVDGKLIENLHVNAAKRLVAMAETIAATEGGA